MKCNLFELTYLPDNTKIWSNADEFLTLIQSNGQATTSYDTYPPFLSKQVSEAEFDTKGTLIVFCFTENTKINCLLFYEGVSFVLDDLNDPAKQANFTHFHQYDLSWSSDISMRSREISNVDTLLKRLYSVVWGEYSLADFSDADMIEFYNQPFPNCPHDITYADLDALDRAYDDIGNARKLICSCHDKESFDNSEVHHCFNVDNKKNWSLIESYVTEHLADSNNVSAWGNENTFLMENDTSL